VGDRGVPEARLEGGRGGLAPVGGGWFVVNARDARWLHAEGRGARLPFEGDGDAEFPQIGVSLFVLEPGEPMGMYHWEADQEDFLVLSGEASLVIEGEERPLRRWDFVHCPVHTKHAIVGAGAGPCAVLAIGARQHQDEPGWGGYAVDETASRRGVGVERGTNDAAEAYAGQPRRQPTRYRRGWLPGDR
jgi:uncharacterized cupin superfamily protein